MIRSVSRTCSRIAAWFTLRSMLLVSRSAALRIRDWLTDKCRVYPRSIEMPTVRVVRQTRHGFVMAGDFCDYIHSRIVALGEWEPNVSKLMSRILRDGDWCVDVGAHVGHHTLVGSSLVGHEGCVLALEPMPGTFKQLSRNLEMNRVANVVALNAAAAERSSLIRMVNDAPGRNTGAARATKHTEDGPSALALSLDDLVPHSDRIRVTLIKMDVEGFESEVLAGARELVAAAKPFVMSEVYPERL